MIELRFRTLALTFLTLLLTFTVAGLGVAAVRYRAFAARPRPVLAVTDPVSVAGLIAPVGGPSVELVDEIDGQDIRFTVPPETVQAALAHRYPGFTKRFPDGVTLTLVNRAEAPEPLRGAYDKEPTLLRMGAVYPENTTGDVVRPDAEAWADCRRDLELGPARSLHCYLYVQGETGSTLDGLATMAWVQAVDYALAGHTQPLDRPQASPFLTATKAGDQWTYADAFLSVTSASDSLLTGSKALAATPPAPSAPAGAASTPSPAGTPLPAPASPAP